MTRLLASAVFLIGLVLGSALTPVPPMLPPVFHERPVIVSDNAWCPPALDRAHTQFEALAQTTERALQASRKWEHTWGEHMREAHRKADDTRLGSSALRWAEMCALDDVECLIRIDAVYRDAHGQLRQRYARREYLNGPNGYRVEMPIRYLPPYSCGAGAVCQDGIYGDDSDEIQIANGGRR